MKKIILLIALTGSLFAACKSKKDSDDKMGGGMNNNESKEEKNRQVIMSSFAAFEKGDLDKAFAEADPSYMDSFDGSVPPMPADSVKALFRSMMAAIPDYKGTDFQYVADGNTVVVLGTWTGTFKNDLMGMKATGKSFQFKDADIFTLNDSSKIIAHRSIANLGAALMAGK